MDWMIKSYLSVYQPFIEEKVTPDDSLLDIGSGLGFVHQIVNGKVSKYLGIEPRKRMYELAGKKWGFENFSNAKLSINLTHEKYDVIFAFSVLDEVRNKEEFLRHLKSYCSRSSRAYIAVRNADFPLRINKKVSSEIDSTSLYDDSMSRYAELFIKSGFDIKSIYPFPRPLITSSSLYGFLKNVFLRISNYIFPLELNYIVCFELRLTDKSFESNHDKK